MPIINDPATDVDPDKSPRRIAAFGIADLEQGFELEAHQHAKGQLMMTMRGSVTCETDGALWIVPPRCAIWIPAHTVHSVKVSPSTEGYSLFIDESASRALPQSSCTVSVTPLLRELVMRCATFSDTYAENGLEKNLAALLIDELAIAPMENFYLPMPSDRRLRAMAEGITSSPSNRRTVAEWARHIGMSESTLHRLLRKETGLSFSQWQGQFHVILALQLLAKEQPVQQVAAELGYESASNFITMFKKNMGMPPMRYMMSRRRDQQF